MAFHNPQRIIRGGCANALKIIEGARYSLLPLHFLGTGRRMILLHSKPYFELVETYSGCWPTHNTIPSTARRRRIRNAGVPSLIRNAKERAMHLRGYAVHRDDGME